MKKEIFPTLEHILFLSALLFLSFLFPVPFRHPVTSAGFFTSAVIVLLYKPRKIFAISGMTLFLVLLTTLLPFQLHVSSQFLYQEWILSVGVFIILIVLNRLRPTHNKILSILIPGFYGWLYIKALSMQTYSLKFTLLILGVALIVVFTFGLPHIRTPRHLLTLFAVPAGTLLIRFIGMQIIAFVLNLKQEQMTLLFRHIIEPLPILLIQYTVVLVLQSILSRTYSREEKTWLSPVRKQKFLFMSNIHSHSGVSRKSENRRSKNDSRT